MDKCPPELHSYICQVSCFDNGQTVRNLSLVSKYYHSVTKPYLYQSIAVFGPSQVGALISKLEAVPQHHRRTRHLLISDPDRGKPSSSHTTTTHAEQQTPQQKSALIARLLVLTAPSLHTLTIIAPFQYSTQLFARLFRTPFPYLEELSISGFYPYPSTPSSSSGGGGGGGDVSCFPSLRKLRLAGNRNPYGLLGLSMMNVAFPALNHLRVEGLLGAASFAQELEDALIDDGDDDHTQTQGRCRTTTATTTTGQVMEPTQQHQPPHQRQRQRHTRHIIPKPSLPPFLKSITVQPASSSSADAKVPLALQEKMMERLTSLAFRLGKRQTHPKDDDVADGGIRFTLLESPSPPVRHVQGALKARSATALMELEWFEKMGGRSEDNWW